MASWDFSKVACLVVCLQLTICLAVCLPVDVEGFIFVCVWVQERGSYGQIKEVCVCVLCGRKACML